MKVKRASMNIRRALYITANIRSTDKYQKSPMHVKRALCMSKELYEHQKSPMNIKRALYITANIRSTDKCQKSPMHVKRAL